MINLESIETLTVGQLNALLLKELKRKKQCQEAFKRWVEKNKTNGTYSEKRQIYNQTHKKKNVNCGLQV